MFDYLYYRLYHYYEKLYKSYRINSIIEWSDEDYHYTTNLALSLWEFSLVFCVAMLLRFFLPMEALFRNIPFVLLLTLGSSVVFLLYNKKHFKNKMPELKEKYMGSRTDKWFKNWMLIVFYFFSILFFFFFPFFFSHLMKWILMGE